MEADHSRSVSRAAKRAIVPRPLPTNPAMKPSSRRARSTRRSSTGSKARPRQYWQQQAGFQCARLQIRSIAPAAHSSSALRRSREEPGVVGRASIEEPRGQAVVCLVIEELAQLLGLHAKHGHCRTGNHDWLRRCLRLIVQLEAAHASRYSGDRAATVSVKIQGRDESSSSDRNHAARVLRSALRQGSMVVLPTPAEIGRLFGLWWQRLASSFPLVPFARTSASSS